jgi:very-short-patch-repair endonuclease
VIKAKGFKSPIETQLRNAICQLAEDNQEMSIWLTDYSTSPERLTLSEQDGALLLSNECPPVDESYESWGDGSNQFSLYSNVSVASYRIDFLLMSDGVANGVMLAIECDGHEWHERTKQQASADRARDRELLRRGLPVIRFTGSDITYDATRCAVEVFGVAEAIRARAEAADNKVIDAYMTGFEKGSSSGRDDGARFERAVQQTRGIYAGVLSGVG